MIGMTKTPKRPRDPNQLAKMMIDIASGDRDEVSPPPIGRAGGLARTMKVDAVRRSEIARSAAKARWAKD